MEEIIIEKTAVNINGTERVIRPYAIDKYPVTNREYYDFVKKNNYRSPNNSIASSWDVWSNESFPEVLENHPVVNVSRQDATAYASWRGKCLPTVLQWEVAAGISDNRLYCYGNEFSPEKMNYFETGILTTTPVDTFVRYAAPSGTVDLCGNVFEWTLDVYNGDVFSGITKGGSFDSLSVNCKIDVIHRVFVELRLNNVGFRCSRSLE